MIIILAIISFFPQQECPKAAQTTLVYAMINENCVLFSDEDLSIPVTSLPNSYFVVIIDEQDEFYRVTYGNLAGYTSKQSVSVVDYTPKYKFGTGKLSLLNDGGIINVRSAPDHKQSNVVARLTDGTVMNYYGKVGGSTQNEIIGDQWFAVSLPEGEIGYVYSMYASASPIAQNVIEPEPPPQTPSPSTIVGAGEKSQYFLIAAMCLPVIILMYLLFKPKPTTDSN